jgi:hypothetical protein
MAKKKAARASAEPASPKRLRRKLDKLESRLASASDKRDRAQARVDALAIMVDEVRATIAAAEEPPSAPEAHAQPTPSAKATKPPAGKPATGKPATANATAAKPATRRASTSSGTRRTTRATGAGRATGGRATRATGAGRSTRSTSPRPRRRPSGDGAGPSGGAAS